MNYIHLYIVYGISLYIYECKCQILELYSLHICTYVCVCVSVYMLTVKLPTPPAREIHLLCNSNKLNNTTLKETHTRNNNNTNNHQIVARSIGQKRKKMWKYIKLEGISKKPRNFLDIRIFRVFLAINLTYINENS